MGVSVSVCVYVYEACVFLCLCVCPKRYLTTESGLFNSSYLSDAPNYIERISTMLTKPKSWGRMAIKGLTQIKGEKKKKTASKFLKRST